MLFFKAMVTGCISFNFVENDYFRQALASLGMPPLTRKQVAGQYLDALSQDDGAEMKESIAKMDYPAGSSDGWRKKYCASGAGLMNFTVMGDAGAALKRTCGMWFGFLCSLNILVA